MLVLLFHVVATMCAAAAADSSACTIASFPTNLQGKECMGLKQNTVTPMGNPIKTAQDCWSTCCGQRDCTTWNWCSGGGCAADGGGCWLGSSAASTCQPNAAWVGGTGRGVPPPPPPPPPALPGAPQNLTLPLTGLSPQPLPYKLGPNVDSAGNTFSVDSVGFLRNGKRFYPISGEIHLARLPASQWREELLKMKAGGLNAVAVYIFWIHHEEVEGMWNFTGRRDVKQFFQHVSDLGMVALLRTGPWDHGRNGGHPDWLLQKANAEHFQLRSNDTQYISYTSKWYTQVAQQVKVEAAHPIPGYGFFFKDGGPIWGVQIDNETSDWKYLLALMQVAMSVGMAPVSFTKTGWPGPAAGYPDNYPMLPFFGGYADLFWSNSMTPNPNGGAYFFGHGPSLRSEAAAIHGAPAAEANALGWTVPAGYPWVDVELGGGMAAAYNHRVHMDSSDMPAMHLCDVANGVNALGYYMYHGGNNPHSTGTPAGEDPEAPENTLQESSFQPAGAQNPMPSFSYDFYAPLGEFGQPREHFHQMRRLHLMLADWDLTLYQRSLPDTVAAVDSDLRWAVRSNGDAGFIFVNNYQRLHPLPPKNLTRFALTFPGKSTGDGEGNDAQSNANASSVVYIPSMPSKEFTVAASSWFVWPFNQIIGSSKATSSVVLAWATAQLLCRTEGGQKKHDADDGADGGELVVMATTEGIAPELAFATVPGATITGAVGTQTSVEGATTVVRNITPGLGAAVTITTAGGAAVKVVLLPTALQDKVWKYTATTSNQSYVLVAAPETDVIVADCCTLSLRGNASTMSFWSAPALPSATDASAMVAPATLVPPAQAAGNGGSGSSSGSGSDGLFTKMTVNVGPTAPIPTAKWTLKKAAGPAREIPKANSGKAQEPTAAEWQAAASYTVELVAKASAEVEAGAAKEAAGLTPFTGPIANVALRLGIDYAGDSARMYLGNRCLTDNWYSGYNADGRMEVGLDYLAGENPEMWSNKDGFTFNLLPLKKSSLQTDVFLQQVLWPDFDGKDAVCDIEAIHVIPTYMASMRM